jgi:hypothetical protein
MASRNPALPLDSHVQSHAEVLKNKLCEFPRSPRSERDRRWQDSTLSGLSPGSAFRYQNRDRSDKSYASSRQTP